MNLDRQADCHASGTVRAVAWAVKGIHDLTLCGHHVGRMRRALEDQGWTIIPMVATKATAGTGTESTGAHHALGG
jgi:microcystin degradation protein MlrC